MGYAEAIAEQMRTLEMYRSHAGQEHLWGLGLEGLKGVSEPERSSMARLIPGMFMKALESAQPFAVTEEIASLCVSAGTSLPPTKITGDMFPAPYGWVLLAESIPLSTVSPFRVFGFLWGYNPVRVQENLGEGPISTLNLWLCAPLFRPADLPEIAGAAKWHGLSPGNFFLMPESEVLYLDSETTAMGAFVALLLFMRQRVLVTSDRPIFGKQVRRKARETFEREPLIRVVEPRRHEHQQRDESHSADVEYSCQWLVRGHWRQHYYPASKEHRPLWIAPHIKGPDDKPLKSPSITAYEVKR